MNPFDWRGPQFLVFYVFFAIAVTIALRIVRRLLERGDGEQHTGALSDPYRIALLRDGPQEMVRVAVVSLVDRGLLAIGDDGRVHTTDTGRAMGARRTLEQQLLRLCEEPQQPETLFASTQFAGVAQEYERELQRMRLIPGPDEAAHRRLLFLLGAGLLLAVSGFKIWLALQRGRTNIGILLLLTPFALWMAAAAVHRRTTARGDAFLSEAKNLFASLRKREIAQGGATADLVMLAAVYGATTVPVAWKEKLFPQAAAGSGDSSSGSSCGSSCGGGCGGGCGGCGG